MSININKFLIPNQNNEDNEDNFYQPLTENGHIEAIMIGFNNLATQDKIRNLLTCLSQVRSSQQGHLKGRCECLIKIALYENCHSYSAETLSIVQEENYSNDPTLQHTIKKLAYYASSYFKRLGIQLRKAYGNNMRGGVSYATTGSTLLLGGLANLYLMSEKDPTGNVENYKKIAWTSVITGASMMTFSIFNACYLAYKNDEYLE